MNIHDPFPIDTIGPALRELESGIDYLREVDPQRLTGDADRLLAAAGHVFEILQKIEHLHLTEKNLEAFQLVLLLLYRRVHDARPILIAAE